MNSQFGIISIKKLPLIIQNFQMKSFIVFLFLFTGILHAQNDSTFVDTKYLEDQLYVNVTYIQLLNLPEPISQNGFSFGFGFGFIKDLPINRKRNIAFGVGLGYGFNNYFFDVKEFPANPDGSNELKSNKVGMHNVEVPIELRFRTSTPKKYKFWRIYPGFKFSYAFITNSNLKAKGDFDIGELIELNRFQYGPTISAGYNKWNFHLYYGLDELITNTKNTPYNITIHDIRLGLIFYIL